MIDPRAGSFEYDGSAIVRADDLAAWSGPLHSDAPQLLFSGPTAVGKSVLARLVADRVATPHVHQRVRVVSAHPGLRYEHLVARRADAEDRSRGISLVEGPLVAMARACRDDRATRVLLLEDVHHVDLAALLGECFMLLDERDLGDGEPAVDLLCQERFSLPRELAIVATTLPSETGSGRELAWRRRFQMVDLAPDPDLLAFHYTTARNDVPDLVEGFDWLNSLLGIAFGPVAQVGHGLFMAPHMTPALLRAVWRQRVLPTLAPMVRNHPVAPRLDAVTLWPSLERAA